MELPKLNTRVVHSESKTAWNVVGTRLGGRYKIARVPYIVTGNDLFDEREKKEAYELAVFISTSFNVIDEMQQDKEHKKSILSELLRNNKPF